jgi:hypothetical protein
MSRESMSERVKRLMAACEGSTEDWDTPESPAPPPNPFLMHYPFRFMHEGHAIDLILFNQYRYYVLNDPHLTDHQYDMLEKQVEKAYPWREMPIRIGSSLASDYPLYIREERWPNEHERKARDEEWGIGMNKLQDNTSTILLVLATAFYIHETR